MTRRKSASQIPSFGGWERSMTELVECMCAKHQVLSAGITMKIQINQRFTGASDRWWGGRACSPHVPIHTYTKNIVRLIS